MTCRTQRLSAGTDAAFFLEVRNESGEFANPDSVSALLYYPVGHTNYGAPPEPITAENTGEVGRFVVRVPGELQEPSRYAYRIEFQGTGAFSVQQRINYHV